MEKFPIKRRVLLGKVGKSLMTFIIAGVPFGLARQLSPTAFSQQTKAEKKLNRYDYQHPIRPPGALSEQRFLQACIQCGNCGQSCPVQAIQFYGNEGGKLAHTPYIQPEIKGCTLCGKCPEVCPSGALRPIEMTNVSMGKAKIDRRSCYPWIDGGICGACTIVCPIGKSAIDFQFGGFYKPFVKDKCVGCGLCVEVCPHPFKAIQISPQSTTVIS